MENQKLERLLGQLLLLCAFVLGVLFLVSSLHVFLADSELWSLSSARFFWTHEGVSYALHYKPAFYALLSGFHLLEEMDTKVLAARYLFGLLGLLQLYLIFVICQRLFKDRTASLLTVVILLSSTFFMVRGFRIRSDYLATTFFLVSLTFLTSPLWHQGLLRKVGFGFSLLLMLASTPKSIYLLLLSAPFLLASVRQNKKMGRRLALSAGAVAIAFLLSILFSPTLRQSYQMSLNYFFDSFAHPDLPPYFSHEALKYLIRLFQENLLLTVAVALNLLFLFRPPAWSKNLQSLRWASALALVPMVFHNHRTPFFLLSMLPPVLIFSGKDLKEVLFGGSKTALKFAIAVVALLTLTVMRSHELYAEGWSNSPQLKYLRDIAPFLDELSDTGDLLIDVSGSLPHPAAMPAYLGAADDHATEALMLFMKSTTPEWILDSYRLSLFGGEDVVNYIADNYVRLPGGIWHRAEKIGELGLSGNLDPSSLLSRLSPQDGAHLHLIFQTRGPRDELTLPQLGTANLKFTYHSPLPLSFLSQLENIRLFDAPMKAAVSPLPFPLTYPLESYSLFYFDTRR